MKKLRTGLTSMKCNMLKGALEAEGIACFIKNEFGEGGGEIGNPMAASMGYSVPELWVFDDNQFERACEITESLQGR